MENGVLAVRPVTALSDEQFAQLADVPPEAEWFANLTNPNTRRAYKSDVRSFMGFLGIQQGQDLRRVVRAHVLAWRKAIATQAPATVRRKLAAVSSLFDYLCDRNAVTGNPVSSIQRPKEGANQGKTPAISDKQARKLPPKGGGNKVKSTEFWCRSGVDISGIFRDFTKLRETI
jgi:site-specific recombinase XerD